MSLRRIDNRMLLCGTGVVGGIVTIAAASIDPWLTEGIDGTIIPDIIF